MVEMKRLFCYTICKPEQMVCENDRFIRSMKIIRKCTQRGIYGLELQKN